MVGTPDEDGRIKLPHSPSAAEVSNDGVAQVTVVPQPGRNFEVETI